MAKFDPTREPSPNMVKRALADYGSDPCSPTIHAFAYLVAHGEPITTAYSTLFPAASQSTAKKQASVLAAHPNVRQLIHRASLPPRELAKALAPAALEATARNLESSSAAVRQRAADSLLDRGGVPRRSEVEQSVRAEMAVSGLALLEMAALLEPHTIKDSERRRPIDGAARTLPAETQTAQSGAVEGES